MVTGMNPLFYWVCGLCVVVSFVVTKHPHSIRILIFTYTLSPYINIIIIIIIIYICHYDTNPYTMRWHEVFANGILTALCHFMVTGCLSWGVCPIPHCDYVPMFV